MFDKKAIGGVDWAVSIALFLVFIAWFFLVTPSLINTTNEKPVSADFIKKCITTKYFYPVYITGYISYNSPLITENKLGQNLSSDIAANIDCTNYLIVQPLNKTNKFYLTSSLPSWKVSRQFIATKSSVTDKDFSARITNGFIREITYRNFYVKNITLKINRQQYTPVLESYKSKFYSYHKSGQFNISNEMIIVQGTDTAVNFLSGVNSKEITLSFSSDYPEKYYLNNISGYINEGCKSFKTNNLILAGNKTYLTLSLPESLISICKNNSETRINATFRAYSKVRFSIGFTNKSYSKAYIGFPLKVKGIKKTQFKNCTSGLKDFAINITNTSNRTLYYEVNGSPGEYDNVYVLNREIIVLENNSYSYAGLKIKKW